MSVPPSGPYIAQIYNASDPDVKVSDMQAYAEPLLPSQAGNSGKYLTTNGTAKSWATIDLSTKQDAVAFLTTLVGIGGTSGSGNLARVTSPTFTTPNIGAATALTIAASGAITVGPTGGSHLVVNTDSSIDTKYISQFLAQYGGYGAYFVSSNRCVWASSSTNHASGRDLSIGRDSTTVLGIYTTASGATYGSLACANVTASGTVTGNRVGVGDGSVSAPSLYGKDTAGTAGWYFISNSCIYATSSYAVFGLRGNFVTGNVSTVFCCTSGDANAGIDVSLGRASSGVWQMGNGTNNANGSLNLTNLTASGTVRLGTYTVATLPSAASNTRARAFVTDSNLAFNSTNLGSTVTAGGSNLVPVFSNGTNWVIG